MTVDSIEEIRRHFNCLACLLRSSNEDGFAPKELSLKLNTRWTV